MKNKISSACAVALCAVMVVIIFIDVLFPIRQYEYVKKYCSYYKVEPSVALAVIWTESKFNCNAVSNAGACGLMQLMPSTAEWLCNEIGCNYNYNSLFEPEFNIKLGIYYLSYLQKSFSGDYVLAAYNAGEGNVKRWLLGDGEIKFAETKDYIKKVNFLSKLYSFRVSGLNNT